MEKRIRDSNYLLIITIGVGDDLGKLRGVLREQVLIVGEVWLVRIVGSGRLIGIGDERTVYNS